MKNLERAMRNALNDDFSRLHRKEGKAAAKNIRIKDQAKYLIQEGQECYPFTPDNLSEAVEQANLADKILLGAYAHTADKLGSDVTKIMLADFVLDLSKKYWSDIAEFIANRDFVD